MMKRLLISVCTSAIALCSYAKEEMYLTMADQTNLSQVKVELNIESEKANVEGFDASILLPSPLTIDNFVMDEEKEDYWVWSSRIGNKQMKYASIKEATGRLYISLNTSDRTKKSGHLSGTTGSVGHFLFDASSLATGDYDLTIQSSNESDDIYMNYRSFVYATNEDTTGYDALFFVESYTLTFHVDHENSTITTNLKKWAKEVTTTLATATEWTGETYAPAKGTNSYLLTNDHSITGTNVVYSDDLTSEKFVITDKKAMPEIETAFTAKKLVYNRTAGTSESAIGILLPFGVSSLQLNGKAYELSKANSTTVEMSEVSILQPNEPYIVRMKSGDKLFTDTLSDVVIYPAVATEKVVDEATHFGTYQQKKVASTEETTYYSFSADSDEALVKVETLTLNPFRSIVKMATSEDGQAATLKVSYTTEGTGIADIEQTNSDEPVDVYDLLGRSVRTNTKKEQCTEGLREGVYVIKGQKVYGKTK